MTKHLKTILPLFFMLASISGQGQKSVTYGKSTFTIYQPLPDLPPTPICGFAPDIPGHTIKNKDYGPNTYYCYAPGNVPKTQYKCIHTEIRDWVGHKPDVVKQLAAKRGLKPVDGKTIKKMFKNTRLPNSGLMYQISDDKWIWFYIKGLQNCGPKAWGSNEEYILGVSFIELVPQQTEAVLDRLYRFWNDGVRFADHASVNQLNFKTRATVPSDKNPNHFSIGDVLNPQKGFYTLSFEAAGKPIYLWHKYEKVVGENLKKPGFDAMGSIGFDDLFTAFNYTLDVVKAGNNLYFSYSVNSHFLQDIEPGRTWQKEMAERKENEALRKVEMKKIHKEHAAALENLYLEIFKLK